MHRTGFNLNPSNYNTKNLRALSSGYRLPQSITNQNNRNIQSNNSGMFIKTGDKQQSKSSSASSQFSKDSNEYYELLSELEGSKTTSTSSGKKSQISQKSNAMQERNRIRMEKEMLELEINGIKDVIAKNIERKQK